jgi:hypothetical protein
MPNRVSNIATIAAGLCTAMAFSANWALASAACASQPNSQLAQGGHWYYRVDHVNDRKCWYLAPITGMPPIETPELGPSPHAMTFSSIFSFLSADLLGPKPTGVQQDDPNSGTRSYLIHPNDQKHGDVSRIKWSRIARHSDYARAISTTSKQQSHAGPRVGGTDRPFDQAERDRLFEEFLQWSARQTP